MENVQCVLISLLGNIDGDAVLYWEIDYDNNNASSPEFSDSITHANWKLLHREAPIPDGCGQARIILRKTGSGSVVIAKVELDGNRYCASNPPQKSTD
jgi:hypothetical protein